MISRHFCFRDKEDDEIYDTRFRAVLRWLYDKRHSITRENLLATKRWYLMTLRHGMACADAGRGAYYLTRWWLRHIVSTMMASRWYGMQYRAESRWPCSGAAAARLYHWANWTIFWYDIGGSISTMTMLTPRHADIFRRRIHYAKRLHSVRPRHYFVPGIYEATFLPFSIYWPFLPSACRKCSSMIIIMAIYYDAIFAHAAARFASAP